MIKPKFFAGLIALFFSIAFCNANAGESMDPPKPLANSVYDSMVGTWIGEGDMMGTKMRDTVKINWALNHQYIVMNLDSQGIAQPDKTYQGMGIFGVNETGKAKTWWFDSWGASAVATGTGTFTDNKLTLTDGNAMFHEVRTFTINGNQMIMTAKGSMTMEGKNMPFEQKVIYTKQ